VALAWFFDAAFTPPQGGWQRWAVVHVRERADVDVEEVKGVWELLQQR
jgi:hypothetical protein